MKKTVAIAILFFVNSANAAFQLELKGYDVFGETESGNGVFGSNAAAITGNVYGTFKIAPEFHLFFNEDLDNVMRLAYTEPGVTPVEKMSPFSEKMLPSSNNLEAGVRYTGFGILSLRAKNMLYLDARPIYPEYLETKYVPADTNYTHTSDAVKRLSRNVFDASWQKTFAGFLFSADVNYFSMHYSVDQHGMNNLTNDFTDTIFNSFDNTYNDVWSKLDFGYSFSENTELRAAVLRKDDLSGSSDYNLSRYSIQLDGTREIPSDNRLAWGVTARWYENKIMQDRGFAIGPGALLYMRDVYELDNSLYLKGLFSMEVGHNLYKQRLEGGVRKAWENESYQEIGYFANQGGLFPTQGFYVKTKEYLVKPFSVAVNIKSVWEGPDNPNYNKIRSENMASYIKTAGNLELAYTLFTHCELLGGVDYTYYNAEVLDDSDFPTRGAGYLGVRMWFE